MNWEEKANHKLESVLSWMDIRIQLYEHFMFDTSTRKFFLPTFEQFNENNMDKPVWVEHKKINEFEFVPDYRGGIGCEKDSVCFRGLNTHCGTRYFTGRNVFGKWTTIGDNFQKQINE